MHMADSRDEANRKGLENEGKGLVDELKGKGRNALGGLTDDTSEQLHGKAEELEGKARKNFGKAQQPDRPDR
jgi:uncharacterized protein YjbJ (UPF0337 family)